jgi:ABC-2 type transport system permease protein
MNFLRLLLVFFRIGFMNEVQYRANFIMQLLKTALNFGWALAAVGIVYSHTDHLNGWLPAELVALLGVFTMMSGLIGVVIQPSMERLIEDVREGTLDFTLTKPEEAQVLVSIGQVRVLRIVDIVAGIVIIAAALSYRDGDVEGVSGLKFAVALAAGTAIMYSFWLVLATISFWFVRVENILMVFHSMYDAARWPITIYPGWLRAALTFLVPVAFAVTVPAEALVGRLQSDLLLATVGLAALMLLASRLLWKVGVKRYSGASA